MGKIQWTDSLIRKREMSFRGRGEIGGFGNGRGKSREWKMGRRREEPNKKRISKILWRKEAEVAFSLGSCQD